MRWAARCKTTFEQEQAGSMNPGSRLFGIVQGGMFEDLRDESLRGLEQIEFDGYAIGGLSVARARRTWSVSLPTSHPKCLNTNPVT